MMRVLALLNPFRWRRSARSTDPRYDDILATLADTLRQPAAGLSYGEDVSWDASALSRDGLRRPVAVTGQVSSGHVTECQECLRRREAERQRKERSRLKRKKRSRDKL